MKNKCKKIEKLLSSHLDNELDAGKTAIIKKHLDSCGNCSETLKTLEEIQELMRLKNPNEPPPFLQNRILSTLNDSNVQWGFLRRLSSAGNKLLPLFTAISILLLIFIGQIKNTPGTSSPVDEYIYGSMTAENNTILLGESPITQDDVLNTILDL